VARLTGGLERDVEGAGAAARALLEPRRAEAARGGGEVDPFEQRRLAGAVAAEKQQPLGRRAPVEGGEVAEVGEAEPQEVGPVAAVGGARCASA
jgi:hypothetical protein